MRQTVWMIFSEDGQVNVMVIHIALLGPEEFRCNVLCRAMHFFELIVPGRRGSDGENTKGIARGQMQSFQALINCDIETVESYTRKRLKYGQISHY